MARHKKEVELNVLPAKLHGAAEALGLSEPQLYLKLLTEKTTIPLSTKDGNVIFSPGATVGGRCGPTEHARVMVVGKMPGWKDDKPYACIPAEALEILEEDYGVSPEADWYVSNAIRFKPISKGIKAKAAWVTMCESMMQTELSVIQPDIVLLLGTDAVKSVMGSSYGLNKVRGSVIQHKGMQLIATINPSILRKTPEYRDGFSRDMRLFVDAVKSKSSMKVHKDYTRVTNFGQCTKIVNDIMAYWDANPDVPRRISMDCEWGSLERSDWQHGQLRSIQFTHLPDIAYTLVLRRCGLIYDPETCVSDDQAAFALQRLISYPGVAIGGHNFREDMHWLDQIGVHCMSQYMRGIDTMLAYHAVYPFEDGFGLEQLAARYAPELGRYDLEVQVWRDNNGFGDKSDALSKHGYAFIPDDLLFTTYAPADVDVVIKAWPILAKNLVETKISKPYYIGSTYVDSMHGLYYSVIHPCGIALSEMETVGIQPDVDRLKHMAMVVEKKMLDWIEDFNAKIEWKGFNFRSIDNVRELLYSVPYGGKECSRPEGAMTLGLTPISTTEKPARMWADVDEESIKTGRVMPAADAESLKIFSELSPIAEELQSLKYLDQLRKNFLRPPSIDKETGEQIWDSGLIGEVGKDGRIHTSLSQLTNTGRYKSYRPNMNNLPKKQEMELRKIFSLDKEKLLATKGWGGMTEKELKDLGLLDPDYYTIRSCFIADPGHVIVEADYKQAELFTLAYLSGDQGMIEMLTTPGRDFHSEMAVKAFRLSCDPKDVKKLYPAQRVIECCRLG